MRIFGSDSMNNILEKLGLKDGESIDHPWINKALERAQQKVEARNFDIRKSLLKFDDVLNDQRHVIFSQRNKVMNSNDSYEFADNFLEKILDELIEHKNKKLSLDKKLLSSFGGAFNDNEIDTLNYKDNATIRNEIKNKFNKKREERLKILGEEQAKEIEKEFFFK